MDAWIEAVNFGADIYRVVFRRLTRFAEGGPGTAEEAQQMILEKLSAFSEAQGAMATALLTGKSWNTAANAAYLPYKRRVNENGRRLAP
jgi:hypothetical protein